MARVVVACNGELPIADGVLASVGGERCESVVAARQALGDPQPRCLVLDPAFGAGDGLGLLAELETRSLRIPVLVLHDADVAWPLRSPFLTPLDGPVCSVEDMRAQLVGAVERVSRAESGGRMFTSWDYFCLAVEARLTVALDLELARGGTLSADLVEGALWNVHGRAGELELGELLDETVLGVAARPLVGLPEKRSIHGSGRRTLRYLAHHAGTELPAEPAPLPPVDGGETRPLDLGGNGRSARDASEAARAEGAAHGRRESWTAERWLRAGQEALLARHLARGEACFRRALDLAPDDPQIRDNLERVREARQR